MEPRTAIDEPERGRAPQVLGGAVAGGVDDGRSDATGHRFDDGRGHGAAMGVAMGSGGDEIGRGGEIGTDGLSRTERGRSGEPRDVGALYDLHGPELFRFAYRILQDRNRAEEAVQDTFVRAWRHADRFDDRIASVRTWLFSIAHNVCIDAIRARNSRPPISDPDADRSDPTTSEPTLEAAMDSWLVEEALRRIRDDQRVAIVETYLRGRTYAEVSAATGTNEATLRSRVFYGLKALRVALDELGWTP
jgi:RNA polymerase sigma-70 factor, ECF subfamily